MPKIYLNIRKEEVWDEVCKVAEYTGAKMTGEDEEDAYERLLITDEDRKSLQRFWTELAAVANGRLQEMLVDVIDINGDFDVALNVSRGFDPDLAESVQVSLKSYFVSGIAGRWFKFCNKPEADTYLKEAAGMMEDALRKLYSRRRPIRKKDAISIDIQKQTE